MTLVLLSILGGLVLLALGGDVTIRGALAAGRRLNISPLLSGLVIVGFGTSAPELAVSVDAALNAQPEIALGNVIGSNISNVLLVLGLCALIAPLAVKPLVLRRDATVVVGGTVLFLLLVAGGALARWDAALLMSAFVAYLLWAYWSERYRQAPAADMRAAEADTVSALPHSWWVIGPALLLGIVMLIAGSRLLLSGAVAIAGHYGVSQSLIGLTLVAVGTSLPELAVSVMAALRRYADVVVGNLLGSNIFNVLGILGVSAMLQPLPISARMLIFDQWVMLGAALAVLLFLYTGRRLSRVEGGILLAAYLGYLVLSFFWLR
jgi:cation:H+ antiporter